VAFDNTTFRDATFTVTGISRVGTTFLDKSDNPAAEGVFPFFFCSLKKRRQLEISLDSFEDESSNHSFVNVEHEGVEHEVSIIRRDKIVVTTAGQCN
jgi:hypothetical protein